MFNPRWADAISSIESGGNYGILGPVTKKGDRAYGRYQVMGSNIGPWTKEVLGRELNPQQFLNDKAAQDAVFQAKFGQSVSKYGNPQDAASVWFTGQPLAKGANRSDVLGTTGASYVSKFNQALGVPNQQVATPNPQIGMSPPAIQSSAQPMPRSPAMGVQLAGLDQLMSQSEPQPALPHQPSRPNVTGLLQLLQSPQLRGLLQG